MEIVHEPIRESESNTIASSAAISFTYTLMQIGQPLDVFARLSFYDAVRSLFVMEMEAEPQSFALIEKSLHALIESKINYSQSGPSARIELFSTMEHSTW